MEIGKIWSRDWEIEKLIYIWVFLIQTFQKIKVILKWIIFRKAQYKIMLFMEAYIIQNDSSTTRLLHVSPVIVKNPIIKLS